MASPIIIGDLRGGMSDEHPAKLEQNQVAYAQNVEYWLGWLGGRRNGSSQFAAPGVNTYFLFRHQPSNDPTADRLWAFFSDNTAKFYDTAAASTSVTLMDTPAVANGMDFASLHGK